MDVRRLHWLLTGQSLVVILLSINRLSPIALGYALPGEALRWVDLNNMLVWPLASVALSYGTLRWIETGRAPVVWHGLLLLGSIYLLGAGYGDHEVTNYLHARFCGESPPASAGGPSLPARVCEIIAYHDDDFSHLVFFAGFIGINLALMLAQASHPRPSPLPRRDVIFLAANALVIALAVFANLAFEATGLDLPVIILVALLALWLWRRAHRQGAAVPVVLYSLMAYGSSSVAVTIAKFVAR